MAYRDDLEALKTRHQSLERELAEIESKSRELGDLTQQANAVRQRLAETRALLENASTRRPLPMLDAIKIAAPCNANWDDMVGDARVRFCGGCEKNVYNLSAMPREEAEQLLRDKEQNLCARLYRRKDGTVISSDCPVGLKKRRVRNAAFAAVGGSVHAAMAAAGALHLRANTRTMGAVSYAGTTAVQGESRALMGDIAEPIPTVMGTVAPPAPPPPPPKPVVSHPMMGKVAVPIQGR